MASRSLRWHLLVGSILWTLGLLVVVHLATVHLFHYLFGPGMFVMTRATFRLVAYVMTLFALLAMAAGFLHVRRGMSALDRLRERLASVRDGAVERLGAGHPDEVQPLADDFDALLAQREEAVRRAQARAGDLAHGLKTPLAVLAREAERAAAAGEVELAATLGGEVERMRRQIEYHLAHARAAGAAGAPTARASVAAAAAALARTLERLYAERGLAIELRVPEDLVVRCPREDLEEMLGNLLDNACKWARSRVDLASTRRDGDVELTIDDDGPGLAPELREKVLQRGVRADESAAGSGLGLAIVADLAELYGGAVALEGAPAGGLRARLTLPAA